LYNIQGDAGSCSMALAAWVCAASLVTIASFCYCELGASVPNAGGDAEYLRLAFGERTSFVFIWTNLWVLKPGSQAIIATIFGEYLGRAFSGGGEVAQDGWIAKGLAVGALILLAWTNSLGIRSTANVQNALTALKGLMILALVVAGIGAVSDSSSMLDRNIHDNNENKTIMTKLIGFGRAVIPCLWAFDGWADLGSLAEDIVNPEKHLPRIILSSIASVSENAMWMLDFVAVRFPLFVCLSFLSLKLWFVLSYSNVGDSTLFDVQCGLFRSTLSI
jgi:amino acid transporter